MTQRYVAFLLGTAVLGTVVLGMPVVVSAQVCNPTCASDEECNYLDNAHTQTGCTVSAVVVTAPAKTTAPTGLSFAGIVANIVSIINTAVIPVLYALAFLFFIIGTVRFFFIEGGEEGQEKGKKFLLYSMIGLVIIFSVWGVVNLLLNTLLSVTGSAP